MTDLCGATYWYGHKRCALPVGHTGSHAETARAPSNRLRPRRTRPRKTTVPVKKITREVLRRFDPFEHADELARRRPITRRDCTRGGDNCERPCPWVGCRHHLFIDVNPESGAITFNFPDLAPWELGETCALDVAERGGITLEETGVFMNLTRERIRQLEVRALLTIKRSASADALDPSADETSGRDAA